jgi:signal transduction histidine kinase
MPERVEDELNGLELLAKKTYQNLRTLLFELRPLGLETHGLVPTLEEYALKFRDPTGMRIVFNPGIVTGRLAPHATASAFLIIQEAVNNARKHARADTLRINVQQDATMLIATIRDNGVGFDLPAVRASYEERGSFGLLTMHERAALLGGSCEIRSAPGAGTQVIIHLPLSIEGPPPDLLSGQPVQDSRGEEDSANAPSFIHRA